MLEDVELIDLAGIATLTGLGRKTIEAYRSGKIGDNDFPKPAIQAGRSPLFYKAEISGWNLTRNTRGRPPKTS